MYWSSSSQKTQKGLGNYLSYSKGKGLADSILVDGRSQVQSAASFISRSPKKTVCPSAWDLSCAEHLMSGETYREGAARGLKEELGLDIQLDNLRW